MEEKRIGRGRGLVRDEALLCWAGGILDAKKVVQEEKKA